MREISTTVYDYAELKGQAKETARQWLQEAITDRGWWEFVYDTWKDALEQIGFTNVDLSFSGFRSQGDGASFTGDIDLEKLADFLASDIEPGYPGDDLRNWIVAQCGKPTNPKYSRLKNLGQYCSPCRVQRTSHQYSHEYTCTVIINLMTVGRTEQVDKLLCDFVTDADTLRRDLCRAIYRDLEIEYLDSISDENITAFAVANGYTFTDTGRRMG